jgi:hypothetical protein
MAAFGRALKRAVLCLGVAVTAFALLAPIEVAAQTTTGTILGVVKDSTGAVVPGAQVTVTNVNTNFSRSATTNGEGEYSLALLPLGAYRVEATAQGFKGFVQNGVALEVGRNARVDPVLQVGSFEDNLVITSDAPLVETGNASLGRTVTQEEVANLPLVNRDAYQLLRLTAGVDRSEDTAVFGYRGQATIINGSPDAGQGSVNYYLDGGSNISGLRNTGNAIPNPDAIQEFRVLTNSFSAEYGRFGGGAVDVITKSGTNALHGSAFEFNRDDRFNAKRWTPGASALADPLKRNQYGATLGGPVQKDKTFFFVSYSGLRNDTTVFKNTAVVPTDLERAGNFSQSAKIPKDPVTGQPFPGNIIPASRFDPTAKRILDQYVPTANLPGGFFETEAPSPINTDEVQIKLDHTIGGSHQLTASYFFSRRDEDAPLLGNLPWVDQATSSRQHNLNLSDNWVVNNSTINTLRLTYVRFFGSRLNNPPTTIADLGSKFNAQGPPSLPQIGVSGYFTLGSAIFGPTAGSNLYMLRDVVSLARGRHSLKIGGEASLEKMIHDTTLNNYGVFSFDGSKTGNALADFLLGTPRTMNQDAPITKTDNVWYFSGFLQDDFHVRQRVTLNFGLRYDLQLPPTDPRNRKLTFVPGAQSQLVPTAPPGILFAGDPGIPRGIINTDTNNISPRVGVAWDPAGDGRTAVRAGFGIFYGSVSGNEWNQTADNQPFTVRQQFNNPYTLTDPYRNLPGSASPYPYTFDPSAPRFLYPSAIYGPSVDFVMPYTYQGNVSVQREIFKSLSVNVAYVGSFGRKYPLSPDINYPVYGPGATAQNVDLRRPIDTGKLSRINLIQSIAGTDYNGLQTTVERRGRHFTAKAFYSFGKALEDASLGESTVQGSGATTPAQDSTNLKAERARSSTDRRHNFVGSVIWKMDYFGNSSPFVRAVFNNWTVSAIAYLRSGTGVTISTGVDTNLDGVNNDRANVVGDWTINGNRSRSQQIDQWFNTAAFAAPATGTDGNSQRNLVDGPGFKSVDMGLFRDFPIVGRSVLQFRLEATNAFNMVNLSNPGASLNAPATFGKIRTANTMRQIQVGARLSF